MDQGEQALAAGNTSAAIEAFSGAVALKGDSMLGYLRRGDAYRRRNQPEEALKDLLHASQLDPTAPRPLELLGDVNASLLRYDRAAARYQAYLAIDDQSPRVLYKLGLVRYRAAQPAEGIAALRKALALDPRFAEAYYLMGLCLRDVRRSSEAPAAREGAMELAPALLPAREELAELYGRLGQVDERLTQLEALVALDPGPVPQHRAGARLLARRHDRSRGVDAAAGQRALSRRRRRRRRARAGVAGGRAAARRSRRACQGARSARGCGRHRRQQRGADALRARPAPRLGHELAERMLQDATTREPVDPTAFFYLADAAERCAHIEAARQALVSTAR